MSTAAATQKSVIGIFDGIANENYHAEPGLSSSGLKHLAKSPAHYLEYKMNPPEQTPQMMLGTAAHRAVLERGLDSGLVLKAPGSTRSTNLFKDFAGQNPHAICLPESEFSRVEGIANAVARHPVASKLLSQGKAEQSAFWEQGGVLCKARPDYLRDDGVVIDLKTSADASVDGFQRSIMKFGYHWQSAWYLDGLSKLLGKPLENFVHLVVESEAPYGIGIYVLDNGSLDKAREDVQKLQARYRECLHTGEWPSYPENIQNIAIPHWAFERGIE